MCETEELRWGGPSFRTFLKLAERWQLSEEYQARILQCGSTKRLSRWKEIDQTNEGLVLAPERMLRIVAVTGVAVGLRYIFETENEERAWLVGPINGRPFSGRSPMSILQEGSAEDIMNVRRYLLGLTQGGPGPNEVDQDFKPYTHDNLIWR